VFGARLACFECAVNALSVFGRAGGSIERALELMQTLPKLFEIATAAGPGPGVVAAEGPGPGGVNVLLGHVLSICFSPLLLTGLNETQKELISPEFDAVCRFLRRLPDNIVLSHLSERCENYHSAALLVLRCSTVDAQLSATIAVCELFTKSRAFCILCCQHGDIWSLLLCLLSAPGKNGGGPQPASTRVAEITGAARVECVVRIILTLTEVLFQQTAAEAGSSSSLKISKLPSAATILRDITQPDPRGIHAITHQLVAPLFEICVEYLCSRWPSPNSKRAVFVPGIPVDTAIRTAETIACMRLMMSCLQYVCNLGPSEGKTGSALGLGVPRTQAAASTRMQAVRRLCRVAEKHAPSLLTAMCPLPACTSTLCEVGRSETALESPPGDVDQDHVAVGLSILCLLFSLTQLYKQENSQKPGRDNESLPTTTNPVLSNFDIAEVFLKKSDVFSRVVLLLAATVVDVPVGSIQVLPDCASNATIFASLSASAYDSAKYQNCMAATAGIVTPECNTIAFAETTTTGERISLTCSHIQLSCCQLLRVLSIDSTARMHIFHYAKFTPSLLSLTLCLLTQSCPCVVLALSDVLSALISVSSKYDVDIFNQLQSILLDFPFSAQEKNCTENFLLSKDVLLKLDQLPALKRYNLCVCMACEHNFMVGNRLLRLVLQIVSKHINEKDDKRLASRVVSEELGVLSLLLSHTINSVLLFWKNKLSLAYPVGFFSLLETIITCWSWMETTSAVLYPDGFTEVMHTQDDCKAFALIVAFIASSGLLVRRDARSGSDANVLLLDCTVLAISSFIQRKEDKSLIPRNTNSKHNKGRNNAVSLQSQNDFLANFLFLDVSGSLPLHRELLFGWLHGNGGMSNRAILQYAGMIFKLLCRQEELGQERTSQENPMVSTIAELLCEIQAVLHNEEIYRPELCANTACLAVLRWIRRKNINTGPASLSKHCTVQVLLYVLFSLDPICALKNMDTSFWNHFMSDSQNIDTTVTMQLIPIKSLIPFVETSEGSIISEANAVITNLAVLIRLCDFSTHTSIVTVMAILLSQWEMLQRNVATLVTQSLSSESITSLVDALVEYLDVYPVDDQSEESNFDGSKMLVAKSISMFTLSTANARDQLARYNAKSADSLYIIRQVVSSLTLLTVVGSGLCILIQGEAVLYSLAVLNNFCCSCITLIEITELYKEELTGVSGIAYIKLLKTMLHNMWLILLTSKDLFCTDSKNTCKSLQGTERMYESCDISDNVKQINAHEVICRLLKASYSPAVSSLSIIPYWYLSFQLSTILLVDTLQFSERRKCNATRLTVDDNAYQKMLLQQTAW
jgi:hypothetical protein